MKFLWKNQITSSSLLNKAVDLWNNNFEDGKIFAEYFIKNYSNNFDYVYAIEENTLTSMAYIIEKKILLNKEVKKVFLIAGVATDKKFLRKGIMNRIMNMILLKYKMEMIFIQSENWNYYQKFNFFNVSNIYEYNTFDLPEKSFLPIVKANWEEIVQTANSQGAIIYTKEKFIEYIKMLKISGGKFAFFNSAYIVYESNIVYEFGFKNIKDFIFLISHYKIKKIKSHIEIKEKNLILKKTDVFTKSNCPGLNLRFNCLF